MRSIKTVDKDGDIMYRNENGEFHRTDGPAYERPSDYKAWIINGKFHREDGPARIYSDGDEYYYLNDKRYSKEDWEVQVIKLKLGRILEL